MVSVFKYISANLILAMLLLGIQVCLADSKGTPTTDAVNVRSGPGKEFPRIDQVNTGDLMKINGQEKGKEGNSWYQVVLDNGKRGYILSTFIQLIEDSNTRDDTNLSAEEIDPSETLSYPEAKNDPLVKLFMRLSFNTTKSDVENYIESNNLKYTVNNYNGSPKNTVYKIAFTEGAALQRYADSGDDLEIEFSREDDSFMFAVYFNQKHFMEAMLFNYGSFFDLRAKQPNNENSGYYYSYPGDDYIRCESAREAIEGVFSHQR